MTTPNINPPAHMVTPTAATNGALRRRLLMAVGLLMLFLGSTLRVLFLFSLDQKVRRSASLMPAPIYLTNSFTALCLPNRRAH